MTEPMTKKVKSKKYIEKNGIKFTRKLKRLYFKRPQEATIREVKILGIRKVKNSGSGRLVKVRIRFKPKVKEFDSAWFRLKE